MRRLNRFAPLLALLGVLACFFVHVPCGPYSATNGPASDSRAKDVVHFSVGALLVSDIAVRLTEIDAATAPFMTEVSISFTALADTPLRC
jgi:hypothetical protein